MAGAARRMTAGIALLPAALLLAACGGSHSRADDRDTAAKVAPARIVAAPKGLLAAAEPQSNGIMWALAGTSTVGLYEFDSASGHRAGSAPVSNAARSLTESGAGIIGLAMGTSTSGALELLDSHTAKLTQTVALPAPARQVAVGSDGNTFYVLTAWPTSASVTAVNSANGKVTGSVPVPGDTVSIAPARGDNSLYALQRNGLIDEITVASGQITGTFGVGSGQPSDLGESIVLSPDGSTLYVLKGTAEVSNVAVVDVNTETVLRVLPAPRYCVQLLISSTGKQLYEMVGAAGYGNIQVFAV
jgi:DNA-binding beta-propeller fold protein YncE